MVLKQKLASRISGIILAYVRGKKGRLTIISDDLKPDMAIIDGIKGLMTDADSTRQADAPGDRCHVGGSAGEHAAVLKNLKFINLKINN